MAWLAVGVTLALAGCSNAAPTLSAQPSASAAPSASATPSPALPTERALVPEGTAEENLPLFSDVIAAVWATPDNVAGRAYIDALIAAGFDRSAMQVTPDQTTVGNPAESIQFSVRWGDECLVGQVGPATGTPVTAVVPVLGEGSCLVGQTRPIDW
ncbi:MAG TPA: hypothetical protein VFX99_07555 [Microbacterium sp.]|nr:hypothetical protein [Microbacterium sp.]HEX5729264.1 hypothetical protein [Microbacterium sp.]